MPRGWTEQNGGAAKGLRRRLIWTGIVFLVSVLPGSGAGIAFLVPGCGAGHALSVSALGHGMLAPEAGRGIAYLLPGCGAGNCLLCVRGAGTRNAWRRVRGGEPLCRESPAGKARNTANGGAAC